MPCPQSAIEPFPLHAACTAVARRRLPPPSPHTSSRTECPPFDSRQSASAFNQPLSFDTSSVTNMQHMFYVRSSLCPAPNSAPICSRALSPLHAAPSPAVSRLLARTLAPQRACTPSFRFSAVRVGVQPAAELQHLQRQNHERHVLRALLPVSCFQSAVEPSPLHAACTAVARRPLASRPARRPAPSALLSTLGSKRRCSTSR